MPIVGPLDDTAPELDDLTGFVNIYDPSLTDAQRGELAKQKGVISQEIAEWKEIRSYVNQPGWLKVLKSVGAETEKLLNNLANEKSEAELHRLQGRLQITQRMRNLSDTCESELERLNQMMDAMFKQPAGAKDGKNV